MDAPTTAPPRALLNAATTPADGEPLDPAPASAEVVRFLARRRSLAVRELGEPGPDDATLERLLTLAARVPDHGKLAPWRFIVLAGAARARLGETIAAAFRTRQPDAQTPSIEAERGRLARAPVVVAVVSAPVLNPKVPEWEQVLSAGAVCHQLVLAANAMGFAAQWITEWYAYDHQVLRALGLGGGERLAGFVHLGTARAAAEERARPDLTAKVTRL
jgi:nitroreductase